MLSFYRRHNNKQAKLVLNSSTFVQNHGKYNYELHSIYYNKFYTCNLKKYHNWFFILIFNTSSTTTFDFLGWYYARLVSHWLLYVPSFTVTCFITVYRPFIKVLMVSHYYRQGDNADQWSPACSSNAGCQSQLVKRHVKVVMNCACIHFYNTYGTYITATLRVMCAVTQTKNEQLC